jgi:hypothetical protein
VGCGADKLKAKNRLSCKFANRFVNHENGGAANCNAAIYVDKDLKYFWLSSCTMHICGTFLEAYRKKREEHDSNH